MPRELLVLDRSCGAPHPYLFASEQGAATRASFTPGFTRPAPIPSLPRQQRACKTAVLSPERGASREIAAARALPAALPAAARALRSACKHMRSRPRDFTRANVRLHVIPFFKLHLHLTKTYLFDPFGSFSTLFENTACQQFKLRRKLGGRGFIQK